MTRKLVQSDSEAVLGLLCKQPSLNVWAIADLENLGFASELHELWGGFGDEQLRAVLLRYGSHFVLSSTGPTLPEGIVDVLASAGPRSLSGAAGTIEQVLPHLRLSEIARQYLAELTPRTFRPAVDPSIEVRRAALEDAEDLYALAKNVAEFASLVGSVEDLRESLADRRVRTTIVRQGGRAVSTASTNVECSASAMVGGVMTLPSCRRRGLASACMTKLCGDLLDEGKVCCLTYHNPKAGHVYTRLGFTVVSPWIHCTA